MYRLSHFHSYVLAQELVISLGKKRKRMIAIFSPVGNSFITVSFQNRCTRTLLLHILSLSFISNWPERPDCARAWTFPQNGLGSRLISSLSVSEPVRRDKKERENNRSFYFVRKSDFHRLQPVCCNKTRPHNLCSFSKGGDGGTHPPHPCSSHALMH